MDRLGWAVFIGTPKGHNFFYKQREPARINKWPVVRALVSGVSVRESANGATLS